MCSHVNKFSHVLLISYIFLRLLNKIEFLCQLQFDVPNVQFRPWAAFYADDYTYCHLTVDSPFFLLYLLLFTSMISFSVIDVTHLMHTLKSVLKWLTNVVIFCLHMITLEKSLFRWISKEISSLCRRFWFLSIFISWISKDRFQIIMLHCNFRWSVRKNDVYLTHNCQSCAITKSQDRKHDTRWFPNVGF